MPHTVERPTDERIIIATLTDPLAVEAESIEVFSQNNALIREGETKLVVVFDISRITVDFSLFMSGINLLFTNRPGSQADKRLHWIGVGNPTVLKTQGMVAKLIPADKAINFYATLDEALAAARAYLSTLQG